MGKTFSVYIKDDEVADNIEEAIEEEYHNQAAFWLQAAEDRLNKEHGDIVDDSSSDFV